ncbi:hypothetical protein Plhal304r1_c033g0104631 [Plasmopara halstedii]
MVSHQRNTKFRFDVCRRLKTATVYFKFRYITALIHSAIIVRRYPRRQVQKIVRIT